MRQVLVPLGLLVLCVLVMFLAALVGFFSSGCSVDPAIMRYLERRYPACDVVKIEEAPFDQLDATIQCPMSPPKTIRIKKRK